MAIEIVDFPIKNGDFPYSYVAVHQRVPIKNGETWRFTYGQIITTSLRPSPGNHSKGNHPQMGLIQVSEII